MQIHNSDLLNELRDGAKLQQNISGIPSNLLAQVTPTMEVNPKLLRMINKVFLNPSSVTLDLRKDFYIVGTQISASITGAASDTAYIDVDLPDETTQSINSLVIESDVGKTNLIVSTIMFPIPIKLKSGGVIDANNAGTAVVSSLVFGYYVDNPNA
jgi:hypothetical protein